MHFLKQSSNPVIIVEYRFFFLKAYQVFSALLPFQNTDIDPLCLSISKEPTLCDLKNIF